MRPSSLLLVVADMESLLITGCLSRMLWHYELGCERLCGAEDESVGPETEVWTFPRFVYCQTLVICSSLSFRWYWFFKMLFSTVLQEWRVKRFLTITDNSKSTRAATNMMIIRKLFFQGIFQGPRLNFQRFPNHKTKGGQYMLLYKIIEARAKKKKSLLVYFFTSLNTLPYNR